MGPFLRAIYFMALFIVCYFLFNAARMLFLPHLKVFVNSAEPVFVIRMLWAVIIRITIYMFVVIMSIVIIFYGIYLIIKWIFPRPFRGIFLAIPPIKQFDQAGIFGLLDAIFGILFSNRRFSDRMWRILQAYADFMKDSTQMIMAAIGTIPEPRNKLFAGKTPPPQSTQKPNAPPPQSSYDLLENNYVYDAYQMCIEANSYPVYPDTNPAERAAIAQVNNGVLVRCKADALTAYLSLLGLYR